MHDPLDAIRQLWIASVANSPLNQKNAVCLSTIDAKGFPSARFVDLKAVDDRGFIFHTNLDSPKARDIAGDPRSALTVFWDHIRVQVRIQGHCSTLGAKDADRYWKARPRDAQLTTLSFQQSAPLAGFDELAKRLQRTREVHQDIAILDRPRCWGGFVLVPTSVEILHFMPDRLHERTVFSKTAEGWAIEHRQP